MSAEDEGTLRVLFCIGVRDPFFEAGPEERQAAFTAIPPAFADLEGRFGIRVMGTMDDDQLMVGPSPSWPWTCYILADAPSIDAVARVCDILRSTDLDSGYKLWRYLKVEARVGRPLFFGNA
ncbi:MAG: hypothetical protein ACR2JH_10030 [Solirubrobacteraceae bacterium]